MITFWRICRTGFKNIFRNAWLSTAATAIMVITLLIMMFFLFSTYFVRNQLAEVRGKIDLSVFLSDEATGQAIADLQAKISASPNVASVEFISKADALKKLENSSEEGKKLAKSAAEIGNPLPASFEVKLTDVEKISATNASLRTIDTLSVITDTSFDNRDDNRRGVVENVIKISNSVSRIGLILSILFLVIALLIIFNTIRMAIFTRREEVDIMKLVGATKWFIRGPFLIEGSLYGVFGAVISIVILIPFTRAVAPFLTDKLGAGPTLAYFSGNLGFIALGMFGVGVLIGVISSWLALIRYLKI